MSPATKPHMEKILFPASGISKGDLIQYYRKISAEMLPFLQDRPLTMQRFPNGITKEGFFQKNAGDYFPDWIQTARIPKEDGWVNHVLVNNKKTLAYLASQAVITFSVTLSTIHKLDNPDKLIFDLDPSLPDFRQVIQGAYLLRDFLEQELQLPTYPMLTGSKGIHIVVPLIPDENFDSVRRFAREIADYLTSLHPDVFTTQMRKDRREGLLFLDYLRNSYAQTAVCPYSVRAIEGAPVAVPLRWEELKDIKSSQTYTIQTVFDRLEEQGNPWKGFRMKAQQLSPVMSRFKRIISVENNTQHATANK